MLVTMPETVHLSFSDDVLAGGFSGGDWDIPTAVCKSAANRINDGVIRNDSRIIFRFSGQMEW